MRREVVMVMRTPSPAPAGKGWGEGESFSCARVLRLGALFLALFGCATPRVLAPAPASIAARGDAVDWKAVGAEAVDFLSRYLQVDTRNPPGNETRGAEFLAAEFEKVGIASETWEFVPGRGSLVARLKATGAPSEKPLCLLSHLDVVTAEDDEWPPDAQPLSGAVKDGFVWGRGALDMKGMGAIEALTLILLARQHVPLKRDVILLAVADEEVDNAGMHLLTEKHWNELDCGVLINEGGIGLRGLLFENQTVFPITVAEKGTLWLRIVAKGAAGHGSTPTPGRATDALVRAVAKIRAREPKPTIHLSLYELLARVGAQKGGLTGFVLSHPSLVDLLVTGKLMANPATRAALTNTCQVTGWEGKGSAPNVIPSKVAAIVDCRVLPNTKPEVFLEELRGLLREDGDDITLEVISSEPASESATDDPLLVALERNLRHGREDIVVGPAISPGFTDSNLARPKGTKAYGLVPFEIDAELLGTMHGKHERLPIKELTRGLEVLYRSVLEVSAQP
ncbi:MAG: M20/M25/M40 family metallo-hydrolase [Archangium sp.]|nr:M20/M25/M40 family metallo-hydrolase [Archangium sp.]